MNEHTWYCPELNEEGFIALPRLRRRASGRSPREFAAKYPLPGLLVVDSDLPEEGTLVTSSREVGGVQLLTETVGGIAILRYLNKVAFVAKRPGNPYAHLVSVGRSRKNDIIVSIDSVSKLHGYFSLEKGRWGYVDHGSTNGSKLNDTALEEGCWRPLGDGDQLRLGPELMLEFLSPEALHSKVLER